MGPFFRLVSMLVFIAAVAFLVLSFKKVNKETNHLKKVLAPAQVTPRQFGRVQIGMSVAHVRRLLGAPDEHARAGGQLCWDYGTPLSRGGMYAVCFRRGEVTYTSRIG
jgi:outer membrane protein assembly factor BamE (lipoprotein component of BamABCDE complex)